MPLPAARCCRGAPAPPHLRRSGPDAAASLCAGPWAGRGRAALGAAEGPGTRHSPPAPLRRNRKDAAGATRAASPPPRRRALPLPARGAWARGGAGLGGTGPSGAGPGPFGTPGTPGSLPAPGRLGLQGVGQEGGYRKLGGGSWDVASGLSRKLSVRETDQGAIHSGSASVFPPLQLGLPHLSRAPGSGSVLQYTLMLRICCINHGKGITEQVMYSLLKKKSKLFITQMFLVPDPKSIQLINFHKALFFNDSHIPFRYATICFNRSVCVPPAVCWSLVGKKQRDNLNCQLATMCWEEWVKSR